MIDGEECLHVREVKDTKEEYEIYLPEYFLNAFKTHPSSEYISLKKLSETVEAWKASLPVLDMLEEEEEGEEEDEDEYGGFEEGAEADN